MCGMTSNHRDIYIVVGTKFQFFEFFGALTIKTTSFSIQTVKLVFKRSHLNLNETIRSHHVVISHRPQRRVPVQTLLTER
jgi:hypothetical protein